MSDTEGVPALLPLTPSKVSLSLSLSHIPLYTHTLYRRTNSARCDAVRADKQVLSQYALCHTLLHVCVCVCVSESHLLPLPLCITDSDLCVCVCVSESHLLPLPLCITDYDLVQQLTENEREALSLSL